MSVFRLSIESQACLIRVKLQIYQDKNRALPDVQYVVPAGVFMLDGPIKIGAGTSECEVIDTRI
jgi:hypothetical protein